MNFVSTLDRAREMLPQGQGMSAPEVLMAMEELIAHHRANSTSPRAPKPLRDGAVRQLKLLTPLLPVLQIEAELAELEFGAAAPGPLIHQFRHRCGKLGPLVASLPEGDERAIFEARLKDVTNRLSPRSPTRPPMSMSGAPAKAAPVTAAPMPGPAAPPPAVIKPSPPPPAPLPEVPPVVSAPLPAAPDVPPPPVGAPAPAPARASPLRLRPVAPSPAPLRAVVQPTPTPKPFTPEPVSPPTKRKPTLGTVLRLMPRSGGPALPLHFVARPQFVIGRFSKVGASLADFSCPLPRPGQSSAINRRHVVLRHTGGAILVRDAGDGKDTFTNGSRLENKVLGPEAVPAKFDRERALVLGEMLGEPFTVRVLHIPGVADDDRTLPSAEAPPVLTGCVRFLADGPEPVPAAVVWLFTDATLGAAPASAVVLPGLPTAFVRVHHQNNAFWLEALCAAPDVRIGERRVPCNQLFPLLADAELHLGPLTYKVAIDS